MLYNKGFDTVCDENNCVSILSVLKQLMPGAVREFSPYSIDGIFYQGTVLRFDEYFADYCEFIALCWATNLHIFFSFFRLKFHHTNRATVTRLWVGRLWNKLDNRHRIIVIYLNDHGLLTRWRNLWWTNECMSEWMLMIHWWFIPNDDV